MAKISKRFFESEDTKETIRINKYLSDSGVCSRREADVHIKADEVFIDGEVAEIGSVVRKGQSVVLCGKEIKREDKLVLIAFHKPKGIVCTTSRKDPNNIIDFINYGSRIYPIGRLDKDSEGLILLTNDGDIVNKVLRAGNHHEKEYIVTVNIPITIEFLKAMTAGVPILDTVTKPCIVEAIDKFTFRIILTQGLNRQIRRMCEYLGYNVVQLKRIRIMNIRLSRLKEGGYRNLTDYELEELNALIKESSNEPISDKEDKRDIDNFDIQKSKKALYQNTKLRGKRNHKNNNMMDELAKSSKKTSNSYNKKFVTKKLNNEKSGNQKQEKTFTVSNQKTKRVSNQKTRNEDSNSYQKAINRTGKQGRIQNMEKKANKKGNGFGGNSKNDIFKGGNFKGGNKAVKEQGHGRNAATYQRAGKNAK